MREWNDLLGSVECSFVLWDIVEVFLSQRNKDDFSIFVVGILIFQRIRQQKPFQFVQAMARCVLDYSLPPSINIASCLTIQEACAWIETQSDLLQLKEALVGNITTYFYCNSCHLVPDSFRKQNTQIFLFKLTSNNEIIAHPIVLSMNNHKDPNNVCNHCGYHPDDIQMNVCRQIFVNCPKYLLVSLFLLKVFCCCMYYPGWFHTFIDAWMLL